MNLRKATTSDAEAIAALSGQLGYPSTPEQVAWRMAGLQGPDDSILAAEEGGRVVGWIHVQGMQRVESDPCAEILGLVVEESCRDQGVGRKLVEAACLWAKEKGYGEIRVRSNTIRADAHRFYEGLDFREVKTQIVFARRL